MRNVDFTNRLTATLPGVPRENLIKFNNSWVQTGSDGETYRYLVAYRAMVFKEAADVNPRFVNPAPQLPGQAGTPWAAGWACIPEGNAVVEAEVPEDRWRAYFDGVGLASVSINFAADPIANGFACAWDMILPNSDGYEDPRLFWVGARLFLHSHRYQPDIPRAVPAPQHRVYMPQGTGRVPFFAGEEGPMYVKVTELMPQADRYALGQEFFYGTNLSGDFEKNYGFFFDGGTLNAVYGVAHRGDPFTIYRACQGTGDIGVGDLSGERRIPCEAFQPNARANDDEPDRDCFVRIVKYYESLIPGKTLLEFSSSGPLQPREGNWHGVGHVKTYHALLHSYCGALCNAVVTMSTADGFVLPDGVDAPVNAAAAYATFRASEAFRAAVHQYVGQADADTFDADIAEYLNFYAAQGFNDDEDEDGNVDDEDADVNVSDEDRARFANALRYDFLCGSLITLVEDVYAGQTIMPWEDNLLDNPYGGDAVILHKNCFYLSFLYQIEGYDVTAQHATPRYRLQRFSDAFLVQDGDHPAYLQFACNVVFGGNNVTMGFGQNDNNARFFGLTWDEYTQQLAHDATHFAPADYAFRNIAVAQTVLV